MIYNSWMKDQDILGYWTLAIEELMRLSAEVGSIPDELFLPEPTSAAEREGLRLFRQEMKAAGFEVELRLCTG